MPDGSIKIEVWVEASVRSWILTVSPDATVESVIRKLLEILKAPPDLFQGVLVFEGRRLSYSETIGSITAGQKKQPLAFILRHPTTDTMESDDATVADSELESFDFCLGLDDSELANDEESGSQVVALDEEGESETVADDEEALVADDLPCRVNRTSSVADDEKALVADDVEVEEESSDFADLDQDVEEEKEEEDCDSAISEKKRRIARETPISVAPERVAKTRDTVAGKMKKATRRATVRYYNRMNPECVYPLLVMITKKMVERAVQEGTDQKGSAPFKVKLDQLVEIEPILPGCACYPPRLTTRLGSKKLVPRPD